MPQDNVIATGFSFPEGPCFDAAGVLHVVELAGGCVARVVDGRRAVLCRPGGSPNGAAFGPDGVLYICNNGGNWPAAPSTGGRHGFGGEPALIQRVAADGTYETVLDAIDGRPLNSPNDICFDDHGGFWFTDPVWAPRGDDLMPDMTRVEPGALGYVPADGTPVWIQTGILFPNGLAVTDGGDALIVDETASGRVYRFPILGPGELGEPEPYADLGAGSTPDGMCFDEAGRLHVAGHGSYSVYVIAAGGGTVEEVLRFEDAEITNVCFGGPEHRTLYVTQCVNGRVATVEREIPGMRLFPDRGRPGGY